MPQNYEEALPFELTPVEYLAPSGVKDEITMVRTFLGSMKYTSEELFLTCTACGHKGFCVEVRGGNET